MDKEPTAFALLKEGTTINFFDYHTGNKLGDNFSGIVRVYIGGTVDAVMFTYLDITGTRYWQPVSKK